MWLSFLRIRINLRTKSQSWTLTRKLESVLVKKRSIIFFSWVNLSLGIIILGNKLKQKYVLWIAFNIGMIKLMVVEKFTDFVEIVQKEKMSENKTSDPSSLLPIYLKLFFVVTIKLVNTVEDFNYTNIFTY